MKISLIRFSDDSVLRPEQPCELAKTQAVPGFIAIQGKQGTTYYSSTFIKFVVVEQKD
jgi:hypothetical protein